MDDPYLFSNPVPPEMQAVSMAELAAVGMMVGMVMVGVMVVMMMVAMMVMVKMKFDSLNDLNASRQHGRFGSGGDDGGDFDGGDDDGDGG